MSPGATGSAAYAAYASMLMDSIRGSDPWSSSTADRMQSALGGEAGSALRRTVGLEDRRALGAFFTGTRLRKDVRDLVRDFGQPPYIDPACGAGDLLLAAAECLPLGADLKSTLELWSPNLVGFDLEPTFVEVARARLAILAKVRLVELLGPDVGNTQGLSLSNLMRTENGLLDEVLPEVQVRDGVASAAERELAGTVLLNPPYGSMQAEPDCAWGSGSIARAAWFADEIVRSMSAGSFLVAILPDVLRSGSRYERWRSHLGSQLILKSATPIGQFDRHTDVDVFMLVASRVGDPQHALRLSTPWGGLDDWQGEKVGDYFDVRIGPVVNHRHAHLGPLHAYLQPRDLGSKSQIDNILGRRRFEGRVFQPPFVVVRRTDRPSPSKVRARGVVIQGDSPVAIENHLVVLNPHDGKVETCNRLVRLLSATRVHRWLDDRIRCRHLTVAAVQDIPWFEDEIAGSQDLVLSQDDEAPEAA